MFGGMENSLYLRKRILFDVSINSSTAMTVIHSDESQNIEFKESWNDKYLQWICGFANAQGGRIYIGVTDNMLQIVNGGFLPDGWTVDTLLSSHRSMPYNPDIANTFFRAGEVEAWGRGIERIIKGCNEDGFSTVDFRYDACGLWTTFSYQYPARVVGHEENIQKTTPTTILTGHETTKETSRKHQENIQKTYRNILKYQLNKKKY